MGDYLIQNHWIEFADRAGVKQFHDSIEKRAWDYDWKDAEKRTFRWATVKENLINLELMPAKSASM